MIHRPSRNRLALALRRYVAKRITNDDLDSVAVDWRDRGANAVKQLSWQIYDDTYAHKAVGRHALSRELKLEIARWVLFLQSDQEYLWPEYNFIRIAPGIGSFFTFGWWGRRERTRWNQFLEAGDFSVWPFINKEAEARARSKPLFLSGSEA